MSATTPDRRAGAPTTAVPAAQRGAVRPAPTRHGRGLVVTDLVGGRPAVPRRREHVGRGVGTRGPAGCAGADGPPLLCRAGPRPPSRRARGGCRCRAPRDGLPGERRVGLLRRGPGQRRLSTGLAAYQYFLLAVTTVVGVLAIRRAVAALR